MSRPDLTLFSYEVLGLVGRTGAAPHDLLRMARRGRMLDRGRAVARILGDLARHDVDQRRAILMAVPGNLAAGLHDELAHAKEAPRCVDLLLAEVDLAEKLLFDASYVRAGK